MNFIVLEKEKNLRIDKFLSVKLNSLTRSSIQKMIDNNQILVNGISVNKKYKIHENDEIVMVEALSSENTLQPENVDLNILYEDEWLAIVEKPKGMLLYPAGHQKSGTLANALVNKYGDKLSNFAGKERPGIVHRIDKDTSGIVIVAFDNDVHSKLSQMLADGEVIRKYKSLVNGVFKEKCGVIEKGIMRDPKTKVKMITCEGGRYAKTSYKVIENFEKSTLLELEIFTGRTHQIRVHLLSIGHPVVGDTLYNPNFKQGVKFLGGQVLHAYYLKFTHPVTGREIEIETDLPDYFLKLINGSVL